ncbi:MAG: AhpC/TSA family protein [Odoribacter sp.]|nr:AhpC/TSA family protein [Odoribacter sp.]
MKKTLIGAAIWFAACFSCSSPAAKDYVIEGEIKGFGDGIMFVTSETIDGYTNDTVFVKNDRFTYRSSTEHPIQLMFMPPDNAACNQWRTYGFFMFVENSSTPIQVRAEVEKRIEHAVITNSRVQSEFEKIKATGLIERVTNYKNQLNQLQKANDTVAYQKQQVEFEQLVNKSLDELFALDSAQTSVAAMFTIYQYFPFLSVDRLENVLQRFSPSIESSVYLEKMQERIRRTRRMAIGNQAPDFKLEDINGKQYTLSDFSGKMVLIDFTASWCHWCKVEIPFIEQVYEAMKGKDFEIISVYLDKKREDWVKDVKNSNHPWKCLSDMKAWSKGGMAYDYNTGGIPNLLLLDKEGRILCHDTRGKETLEMVKKYYK